MFAPLLPLALLLLVVQSAKKRPRPMPPLGGPVTAIAYAPDGSLVCASANGLVQKWMPELGKWRSFRSNRDYLYGTTFSGSPVSSYRLRFSSDGKVLYVGGAMNSFGQNNPTTVWDARSRAFLYRLYSTQDRAFDVSRDGQTAASSEGDQVWIYPIGTNAQLITTPTFAEASPPDLKRLRLSRVIRDVSASDLCLSPDGAYLAISRDLDLALFDARTGSRLGLLEPPPRLQPTSASGTSFGPSLAWSPDGAWIAAASNTWAAIWDKKKNLRASVSLPRQSRSVVDEMVPLNTVRTLAFSPDSTRLAIGGIDAHLLSLPDLKEVRPLPNAAGGVAFSPDGQTLATGHQSLPTVLEWHL